METTFSETTWEEPRTTIIRAAPFSSSRRPSSRGLRIIVPTVMILYPDSAVVPDLSRHAPGPSPASVRRAGPGGRKWGAGGRRAGGKKRGRPPRAPGTGRGNELGHRPDTIPYLRDAAL